MSPRSDDPIFTGDDDYGEGDMPTGRITLQTLAMPADTNANGDIFGGWLMAQMDLGSSVLARSRAKGRVATVFVEGMKFHRAGLAPRRDGSSPTAWAGRRATLARRDRGRGGTGPPAPPDPARQGRAAHRSGRPAGLRPRRNPATARRPGAAPDTRG